MKKHKLLSLLMGLCLILSMIIMPAQQASAATNEEVLEARNGVVEVAVQIAVNNSDYYYTPVGTGFLVGTDGGSQTVITNFHVAHAVDEAWAREAVGAASDAKIGIQLQIVGIRDMRLNADIVNESEQADFSILKLTDGAIYDRAPLTLGDSSAVVATQEVYALGFPSIVQSIQNDELYTTEDVTITNGTVSKTNSVVLVSSPIPCITHSARLSEGNSGGPLVDANGVVVGINSFISNDSEANNDYFFSTQISEIRSALDMLGIEYKTADSSAASSSSDDSTDASASSASDSTASDASSSDAASDASDSASAETEAQQSALFDDLKAEIDKAGALDVSGMTEDSVANFNEALNAAEAVYRNTASTDAEIQSAISDLQTAENGLVEATNNTMLIIIIAVVAVVVIVLVVVLILVKSSKKKKAAAEEAKKAQTARQARPAGGQNPQGHQGFPQGGQGFAPGGQSFPQGGQNPQGRPGFPQGGQNPQGRQPFNGGFDEGSADTGVLNDGGSATTVLSGGAGLPAAYFTRRKNGARVQINKQIFKVGKERRNVDFCISDNTNISRTHVNILYKNGDFYIVDNNSTNGTSLNGVQMAPGKEYKLNSGDRVTLADEEFTFSK